MVLNVAILFWNLNTSMRSVFGDGVNLDTKRHDVASFHSSFIS